MSLFIYRKESRSTPTLFSSSSLLHPSYLSSSLCRKLRTDHSTKSPPQSALDGKGDNLPSVKTAKKCNPWAQLKLDDSFI